MRKKGALPCPAVPCRAASRASIGPFWSLSDPGAQCGAKFASNEALKSVSYPIQAGDRFKDRFGVRQIHDLW